VIQHEVIVSVQDLCISKKAHKQSVRSATLFATTTTFQLFNHYTHQPFCKFQITTTRTTMKYAITAGAVIAAAISGATAQACAAGSAKEIGGNWYCDAVKAITYVDFGSTGIYNKITSMEGGNCQSEPFEYSGALAPMNGEVRTITK
jgi:Glycine-rich protein domain (DUF2403)